MLNFKNTSYWIAALLFCLGQNGYAQVTPADFNLTSVGQLSYTQNLNDIWGYRDATGVEYALVGTTTGTSIVSLADPANPTEILFISGQNSIWRDLKTWNDHAFVTTEAKDGLLVIDLSPLPNGTPTYYFWKPTLSINGDTDILQSAHNLYIDENGYCYIAGSNISRGEAFILDVHTNPDTPTYKGATLPFYAHDAYTRGDTLWTSDINDGVFSVYDVRDKTAPVRLATQSTPRDFAHNAWISDDNNSLFTTDEKTDAWIASYDVSDLSDIKELDRYRTPTPGTIPHNTHTLNDFLVTSYYTDGLIIIDASRPDNLVEVGRYDTYNGSPATGFHGAWGAYPFLPSGLVLVSDINTGLHVLRPNYQRACWLEGLVTDQATSAPIFGVQIDILNTSTTEQSRLSGAYKTGMGLAGTYQVRFRKAGYLSQVITVTLSNGTVTTQNIQLVPATAFQWDGQVIDQNTNNGIPNAHIWIKSDLYEYRAVADASGNFRVTVFPDDTFRIVAGQWGYRESVFDLAGLDSSALQGRTYPLMLGYKDDFVFDYGWSETGTATSGNWTFGVPNQVTSWRGNVLPDEGDLRGDIGKGCLITGNSGNGNSGSDDVDNGYTRMTSPMMDLTTYDVPILDFYYFLNMPWPPSRLDSFNIYVSNGSTTALVWSTTTPEYNWSDKQSVRIDNFIALTSTMQVMIQVNDSSNTTIESLFDGFEIRDSITNSVTTIATSTATLNAFPNPFGQNIQVDYQITSNSRSTLPTLVVYNALGQIIETRNILQPEGRLQLGDQWQSGLYFITLGNQTLSILKQEP